MLIPVMLAGGSGTRLWPLSRSERPKQFSKLCSNKTLFQDTLERIRSFPDLASPIIVCNEKHKKLVLEQLAELNINDATLILEPFGRNTAPAITLAALLALKSFIDPTLLVLPADHAIADINNLHAAISKAKQYALRDHLVCFGVPPTRPETGYGYIKIGEELSNIGGFYIEKFVEKPSRELADNYLKSKQYFWNSGIFMFGAKNYLAELQQSAQDIYIACQEVIKNSHLNDNILPLNPQSFKICRSDSIDYAVMEHTQKAAVVPLDAGWSDIGSWLALWENRHKDACGNVALGEVLLEGCENSYVHAASRKVVALGVKDHIIIETDDTVLVLPKEQHQEVKKIVEKLDEN